MDTTTAILFTLYMVPVNLLDNILRPLVAKGLKTPMPVYYRRARRYACAWHHRSICRTDCTFNRLAIACGLGLICAETLGRG